MFHVNFRLRRQSRAIATKSLQRRPRTSSTSRTQLRQTTCTEDRRDRSSSGTKTKTSRIMSMDRITRVSRIPPLLRTRILKFLTSDWLQVQFIQLSSIYRDSIGWFLIIYYLFWFVLWLRMQAMNAILLREIQRKAYNQFSRDLSLYNFDCVFVIIKLIFKKHIN